MIYPVPLARVPAVCLLSLSLAACGTATSGTAGASSRLPADSLAALEAIYRARQAEAQTRFTPADVRFMTRMIGHHAQAIEMAELAPARTEDGEIRTLAARIINAQDAEIETMRQWLRDRDQPVPEAGGHAHDGTIDMPGMIAPEQMRRLEAARGAEFDRLFLTLMIQHHTGAITMVEELFATDGAGQDEAVFKFASDAQVDQKTEVDRMELMLQARGGIQR